MGKIIYGHSYLSFAKRWGILKNETLTLANILPPLKGHLFITMVLKNLKHLVVMNNHGSQKLKNQITDYWWNQTIGSFMKTAGSFSFWNNPD